MSELSLGMSQSLVETLERGAADVYFAPHYAGKRWDACASDALIRAAGGKLTNSSRELFDYRAPALDNN